MAKERRCGRCGKKKELSARGICYDCGAERFKENIKQQKSKSGPFYERWREGMLQHARKLSGSLG